MKCHWLVASCAGILVCPAAWMGSIAGVARGQQAVAPPAMFKAPVQPATAQAVEEIPLGSPFESQSAGVLFRPPVDCELVHDHNSNYIAEWVDVGRDWTLKLGRMILDKPTPLISGHDNLGKQTEGVLDITVRNLKARLSGSKVLRQDLTNTRDAGSNDPKHPEYKNNVGLIMIRYVTLGAPKLSQQAIIQATDGIYYLITLTSPGRRSNDDNAPEDAGERLAVETFGRMVDSVRLLDRSAVKQDQDNRLYESRAALVNWTPSRMHAALINEKWMRIIKNGKDVGYTYVTENVAGSIPRPLTQKEMNEGKTELDLVKNSGDGVLIGVRARMIQDTVRPDKTRGSQQVDSSSWFYVSSDKRHENFSRVVVTDDHVSAKKGYSQEFGVSEKRSRRSFIKAEQPKDGGLIKPSQELVPVMKEEWQLDVSQTTAGLADSVKRDLPPWYLPQALTHLLPRLLPLQKPRKYMFASYVSEAREVMMRYVDVLADEDVHFNGRVVRAVRIMDRLGLEGPPMIHYMTLDGTYLGSENPEQKLVFLPTDAGTLQHIWRDVDLSHPDAVNRPGPANANAGTPK